MKKKPKLSIIILNYNTQDLLKSCLQSLQKVSDEVNFQLIVVDNGSTDQSIQMLKADFPEVDLVENKENLGFAVGNNRARKTANGEYILFLNSDTETRKGTLKETIAYLEKNPEVGALTCKIELPSGELDKDSRRAFPTPWVALTHFSGLDRLFPKSRLFSQYWYGYLPENEIQEVDALQGAFFLTRKKILDQVGWFDEDYFLDGEDIDLCWQIKEKGYQIVYFPKVSILHLKKGTKKKQKPPKKERLKYVLSGVNSMEIFYKKRLIKKYPLMVNFLVLGGIKALKLIRLIKALLF